MGEASEQVAARGQGPLEHGAVITDVIVEAAKTAANKGAMVARALEDACCTAGESSVACRNEAIKLTNGLGPAVADDLPVVVIGVGVAVLRAHVNRLGRVAGRVSCRINTSLLQHLLPGAGISKDGRAAAAADVAVLLGRGRICNRQHAG